MSVETTPLPAAFNRLAWSNLAAQSAEQVGLAAAPIVAVLALGAGAGETGLLQTAQTLPFLLLAIPAGLLADRMSRRRLLAGAETLRAASLVAILALAHFGGLTWWLLALFGLVGACGTVVYSVAAPALVPALVPRHALADANARIELARTFAFAGGPALAGALAGWLGAAPVFALAAALSVLAVLLLARLPEPAREPFRRRRPVQEIREGLRFAFGHALLRPVFVTQTVFNAAFFMMHAAYAPHAARTIGLSAAGIGATITAYGAGMVVGALLATRIVRALPFGIAVAIGPVAGLAASVAMALTIWVPSGLLAAASFFLMGAGPIVWTISTTTLRQTVTPPDLLGRVSAVNIMVYGSRPVGAAAAALIGSAYGAEACLLAASAGFAAQAAVILTSPVVRLARQPQDRPVTAAAPRPGAA